MKKKTLLIGVGALLIVAIIVGIIALVVVSNKKDKADDDKSVSELLGTPITDFSDLPDVIVDDTSEGTTAEDTTVEADTTDDGVLETPVNEVPDDIAGILTDLSNAVLGEHDGVFGKWYSSGTYEIIDIEKTEDGAHFRYMNINTGEFLEGDAEIADNTITVVGIEVGAIELGYSIEDDVLLITGLGNEAAEYVATTDEYFSALDMDYTAYVYIDLGKGETEESVNITNEEAEPELFVDYHEDPDDTNKVDLPINTDTNKDFVYVEGEMAPTLIGKYAVSDGSTFEITADKIIIHANAWTNLETGVVTPPTTYTIPFDTNGEDDYYWYFWYDYDAEGENAMIHFLPNDPSHLAIQVLSPDGYNIVPESYCVLTE